MPIWPFAKKTINRETVQALSLLCFAEPEPPVDITPLRMVATLKAMLAHFDFTHGPLARTLGAGALPHDYLSDDAKSQVLALARGKLASVPGQSWPSLLVALWSLPKFGQAFRDIHGQQRFDDFMAALARRADRAPRPLIAELETATTARVSGWVVDPAQDRGSLVLKVFANGRTIAETRAHLDRADVAAKHGGHGRYGFDLAFELPPDILSAREIWLDVVDAATGTPLAPPRLVQPDREAVLGYVARLVRTLTQDRAHLNTAGLSALLNDLKAALPELKDMVALPIEDSAAGPPVLAAAARPSIQDIPAGWQAHKGLCLSENAVHALETLDQTQPDCLAVVFDWLPNDPTGADGPARYFTHVDYDRLLADNPYADAVVWRDHLTLSGEAPRSGLHALLAAIEMGPLTAVKHVPHLARVPAGAAPVGADAALLVNRAKEEATVRETIRAHLTRRGLTAQITSHTDPVAGTIPGARTLTWAPGDQKISVIIPTRDGIELLAPCVQSLFETAHQPDRLDLIILDNQSSSQSTRTGLERLQDQYGVRVLDYNAPFNWSAINMFGAHQAAGEHLLFLNDDTLSLTKGWDDILSGLLNRPDMGVVGARLLYGDGRIQHGGITIMSGARVHHDGAGDSPGDGGYLGRTRLPHAASAVTGAFLATKRSVFETIGGFDVQRFAITYNDIDYCFAARAAGHTVLYTPDITFAHHEGKSRGFDKAHADKARRADAERMTFLEKWPDASAGDPYYPSAFVAHGHPWRRITAWDRQAASSCPVSGDGISE